MYGCKHGSLGIGLVLDGICSAEQQVTDLAKGEPHIEPLEVQSPHA